jgi:hypothetical protein
MAPPSSSGGRKRKRGRRNWEEGGSGAHGVHEPTFQARQSQREETHEPGTRPMLSLTVNVCRRGAYLLVCAILS